MSTPTPPAPSPTAPATPSPTAPATPTNPTGTPPAEPGYPPNTPVVDMTAEQQAAYWKQQSRKHEDQWKTKAGDLTPAQLDDLRAKAKRADELDEANKTELQKAADRATAAESAAAQSAAEAAVLRAAVKHKLTDGDLELLGTHGTPEEIDARAEKLAARLATTPTAPPPPDFGGGARGGDVNGTTQLTRDQLKDMSAEEIDTARKAGRLDTVLGIKPKP